MYRLTLDLTLSGVILLLHLHIALLLLLLLMNVGPVAIHLRLLLLLLLIGHAILLLLALLGIIGVGTRWERHHGSLDRRWVALLRWLDATAGRHPHGSHVLLQNLTSVLTFSIFHI
jgi:hypothetical protein